MWQAAGVCYNILTFESCRKGFLARGAISIIFELAASDFTSVRHVCSACIHIVPEHLPNLEDPVVLQLILCLLDADGAKQSELGEKCLAALQYLQPVVIEKSPHVHLETNFKPTWTSISCKVDSVFSYATIPIPDSSPLSYSVKPFDSSSILESISHFKSSSASFNDFDFRLSDLANSRDDEEDSADVEDVFDGNSMDHDRSLVEEPSVERTPRTKLNYERNEPKLSASPHTHTLQKSSSLRGNLKRSTSATSFRASPKTEPIHVRNESSFKQIVCVDN